jgi:hypothetical protein
MLLTANKLTLFWVAKTDFVRVQQLLLLFVALEIPVFEKGD